MESIKEVLEYYACKDSNPNVMYTNQNSCMVAREALKNIEQTTLYAIRDKVSGEYCRFLGMGGTISLHTTEKYFDIYFEVDKAKEIIKESRVYGVNDIDRNDLEIVTLNITITPVEETS